MGVIDLKNRYCRAFTMPEVALAVGGGGVRLGCGIFGFAFWD
jgi:hypothetical protein